MKIIEKREMGNYLIQCRFLTILEGTIEDKSVRCYLYEDDNKRWFSNVIDLATDEHLMSVETDALYEDGDRPVIGDIVEIKFPGLSHGATLKGRVDTGATTCSLHVDDVDMLEGDRVQFKNAELSDSSFTLTLAGKQEVSSADNGSETRPMVKLDVKIDGKSIDDVEFNLNDRSNMDHPVLVGQNLLESGNFMIDPKINEEGFLNELALMFPQDTIKDMPGAALPIAVSDVPEEIPAENLPELRMKIDPEAKTLSVYDGNGQSTVYRMVAPEEQDPAPEVPRDPEEHPEDFSPEERLDYIAGRINLIKDDFQKVLTLLDELDKHWIQERVKAEVERDKAKKAEPKKKPTPKKKPAPKKEEPKEKEAKKKPEPKKEDKKEEKKEDDK